MDNFFRTRMGMTFFEGTLPRLVVELKRLNDNLEADRKERANAGVSREYVLNQLAGMKFPEQGQAYDFIKKCFGGEDHATGHSEFACPGCGCEPGDGRTDGCTHPDGCGR